MATLQSANLRGAYPSGSSTGGGNEYIRVIEIEPEPQDGSIRAAHRRLDTWKEIAAYFSRSVRCVQRWERFEGLPVHRHQHCGAASVYAYRFELDVWWEKGSAFVGRFANQR